MSDYSDKWTEIHEEDIRSIRLTLFAFVILVVFLFLILGHEINNHTHTIYEDALVVSDEQYMSHLECEYNGMPLDCKGFTVYSEGGLTTFFNINVDNESVYIEVNTLIEE